MEQRVGEIFFISFLDDGTYNVVLKKATVKSDDPETLKKRTVTCVPELSKGKTYSWADVTCTIMYVIDIGAAYRSGIGKQYSGYLKFSENDAGIRTMTGSTGLSSFAGYSRISSFGGCWTWWGILILVLVIIIIIALVVLLILKFGKGKGKSSKKSTKK